MTPHRNVYRRKEAEMNEARQVKRQIELFMQDGKRERLTVALAILEDEIGPSIAPWHYNHPDNIAARRDRFAPPHTLVPDGRGQGMRVCTKCGRTEPEPDEPCGDCGHPNHGNSGHDCHPFRLT